MRKSIWSLGLLFSFLSPLTASAWSLKEAHNQANTTLVQVGDFCSGTVIDKAKGLVVTAAHCAQVLKVAQEHTVERPDGSEVTYGTEFYKPVELTIANFDEQGNATGLQKYEATVVKAVFPEDVAILKSVSPAPFTGEVSISTAPMSYGDKVYTVGNPLMVPSVVSDGSVIKPQFLFGSGSGPVNTIMFNAFMAPGSSGGGLFNDRGELVGITDWAGPGGPYLASPVQNVINLLKDLEASS